MRLWQACASGLAARVVPPPAFPYKRMTTSAPAVGCLRDGLADLLPTRAASARGSKRAQHLPPGLAQVEVGRIFGLEHHFLARRDVLCRSITQHRLSPNLPNQGWAVWTDPDGCRPLRRHRAADDRGPPSFRRFLRRSDRGRSISRHTGRSSPLKGGVEAHRYLRSMSRPGLRSASAASGEPTRR
jgi:hypothetical protein